MGTHTKEMRKEFLRANIKRGFVLHLDPDWLLLTYGSQVVYGECPRRSVGARYAVCTDIVDDIYFWALLTTSPRDNDIPVPNDAKVGPWLVNGKANSIIMNSVWMLTLDMVVEAHLMQNRAKILRNDFVYSAVKPHMLTRWPVTPVTFPKTFEPLPAHKQTESAKPADFLKLRVVPDTTPTLPPTPMDTAVPETPVTPTPEPVEFADLSAPMDGSWREWVAQIRKDQEMTQQEVAAQMGLEGFHSGMLSAIERGRDDRRFSVHELATWAKVMGVQGHPVLRQIPVLSDAEATARSIHSARTKAAPRRARVVAPAAPAPTPFQPLVPVAPDSTVDRKALAARVERLLANSRLTDTEVAGLVSDMESRVLNLLMGVS